MHGNKVIYYYYRLFKSLRHSPTQKATEQVEVLWYMRVSSSVDLLLADGKIPKPDPVMATSEAFKSGSQHTTKGFC